MFSPEEIIFVPTQACNLCCPHCFVPKSGQTLPAGQAIRFLSAAADDGIPYVGFSGGEPFLNLSFLEEIIRAAVERDMLFDRIMTNAAWWETPQQLEETLLRICDAGFDGRIGISFDSFHGSDPQKTAVFIRTVEKIWDTRTMCGIVCVRTSGGHDGPEQNDENAGTRTAGSGDKTCKSGGNGGCNQNGVNSRNGALLSALARELGASLVTEDGSTALRYTGKKEPHCSGGAAFDEIPVIWIDYIPQNCTDPAFWQSPDWFEEDFCAGPGNVYYINADGSVAACCGYANDFPELIVGNILTQTYSQIKEAALASCADGFLKCVYGTGLRNEAVRLERQGTVFPGGGRTADNCLFCRYLLEKQLPRT